AQLEGLAKRQLEDLLGPGGEGDVPGRRLLTLTDDLDDLVTNRCQVDVQRLEGVRGDAFTLVEKPEQDVLGADVIVVQVAGLFLSEDHHSASSVCEALKHSQIGRASCRERSRT